jgi:hypothetical protein
LEHALAKRPAFEDKPCAGNPDHPQVSTVEPILGENRVEGITMDDGKALPAAGEAGWVCRASAIRRSLITG